LEENTPQALPFSEQPSPIPSLPFQRPSDYYSSPVGEGKPLFPRWVTFGCGGAAIVVLLVVFGAGIAASSGGLGEVLDLVFSSIQTETEKLFTPEVKSGQRAAFAAEMKKMRDSIRNNKLSLDRLQPLLRDLREATSDERVSPAEVKRLIKEIHAINSASHSSPPNG
jgi:hypothetical protein